MSLEIKKPELREKDTSGTNRSTENCLGSKSNGRKENTSALQVTNSSGTTIYERGRFL